MDISTEQHSFFAPPSFERPRRKKKLPRKRRLSTTDRPSTPPAGDRDPLATGWAPVNRHGDHNLAAQSDQEASEDDDDGDADGGNEESADQFDNRGGNPKGRHNEILARYNLPVPEEGPSGLRRRHQMAMTAILHRSLLEGDYVRGNRAYGLLLRSKHVDIRRIWGIGLEILLRRPEFSVEAEDWEVEPGGGNTEPSYNPANLSKALEFLNRLILLYPYHASRHSRHPALGSFVKPDKKSRPPPRPSVLEFYPALFNLLVRASPCSTHPPSPPSPSPPPELRPEKIKEQIETLMMSPPFTNLVSLWLLRGMICNWIADLAREDDVVKSNDMRREAEECFENVRERGGEVPDGVERGRGEGWSSEDDDNMREEEDEDGEYDD